MKKYIAEFIGTFALVFIGCAAYTLNLSTTGAQVIIPTALAFGMVIVAVFNSIYKVSGAHINPAVTLGAFAADRMKAVDTAAYIIAQFLGGLLGAFALYLIAISNSSFELIYGLGQNGYGDLSLGGYGIVPAILFELIASFLFVYIYLASTSKKGVKSSAGISIGLFYAAAVISGFLITGASLNPARSFGPGFIAGFANPAAWFQLPLFILAPAIAGLLAGLMFKFKVTHGKLKKKEYDEDDTKESEESTGSEFGEQDEIEVIEK